MSGKNQTIPNELNQDDWVFQGFLNPTTTPVPDEFFDFLAPLLKEAELRVALYIIRRTFGFKKVDDDISLRQMVEGITTKPKEGVPARILDRGTGLSKPAVIKAVKSLVRRGVVIATSNQSQERGFEATTYRLNILQAAFDGSPLLTKFTRASKPKQHALVNEVNIQETVQQNTVEQKTDLHNSNIRNVQPAKKTSSQRTATPPGNGVQTSFSAGEILAQQGRRGTAVGEATSVASTRKQGRTSRRPRPETETEEWQAIQQYVDDFMRQLGDSAPRKSSTTRAYNLFVKSGVSLATFLNKMYEARSRTQESSGVITAEGVDPTVGTKRKTKAAYFFAILEDTLGLISEEERERRAQPKEKTITSGRGKAATTDEAKKDDAYYDRFIQR